MKNSLITKIKKLNLNKEKLIEKPIKVFKKIKLNKLKNITSFSLNKTFDKFKEKIKQAEIERSKIIKKEKFKKEKKEKLEQKKQKAIELKKNKKLHLLKAKEEKQRLD